MSHDAGATPRARLPVAAEHPQPGRLVAAGRRRQHAGPGRLDERHRLRVRSRRVERNAVCLDDAPESKVAGDADEHLAQRDHRRVLARALDQLSDRQRELLDLNFVEGKRIGYNGTVCTAPCTPGIYYAGHLVPA